MKKLTLLAALTIILFAFPASAGLFPQIVGGHVSLAGGDYEGLDVLITNIQTRAIYRAQTDGTGNFVVDVSPDFTNGQSVQVEVCKGKPECMKVVQLKEGLPVRVDFNFTEAQLNDPSLLFNIAGYSVAGIVIVLLALRYRSVKKDYRALAQAAIKEILELAPNTAVGKLKDIKSYLDAEMRQYAYDTEAAGRNRPSVLKVLLS